MARLAQSVERKALNLVVVGSSPTVGVLPIVGFAGALSTTQQQQQQQQQQNDTEGIRTPAGRAQWISSPSP